MSDSSSPKNKHSAIGEFMGENTPNFKGPAHGKGVEQIDEATLDRIRGEVARELEQRMIQARIDAQREAELRAQQRVPAHNRRTVREMSAPLTVNQPWCIVVPRNGNFELRSAFIHQLPKFHGMSTENPVTHVREFLVVCDQMRLATEDEEALRLKAFPFSLNDQAKHWLMSLPAGSIRTWEELQQKFLDKYYPAAKISLLRRELAAPKQGPGESLYEYYERFKTLEANCYNHGLPQNVLIENFLNGLLPMELRLLNACANGNVRNLYPEDVWRLVEDTADQVRYQVTLENSRSKPINQVDVTGELKELKDMMYKLMVA